MFIATIVVSVLLALAATGSGVAKLKKDPKVVGPISALGVPLSWLPRLAAAEFAGALGLLVGLAVPAIGIAAATGLVLYFLGAVVTHLRAGDKNIAAPGVLMLISVAALVLRLVTI